MAKRRPKYDAVVPEKLTHVKPRFVPISTEQEEAYSVLDRSIITFLTGPAGCTKTFTAMAYAIDQLLARRISKIVLSRPAIEACGERLGFLPGESDNKMGPYVHPLNDVVIDYAPDHREQITEAIEVVPLAYMRGRTLKHCVAILDEAQNCNEGQIKMFLTRLGTGSKMVVCGDPKQSDIGKTPLESLAKDLSALRRVSDFRFTAPTAKSRHPLIPDLISVFDAREI